MYVEARTFWRWALSSGMVTLTNADPSWNVHLYDWPLSAVNVLELDEKC